MQTQSVVSFHFLNDDNSCSQNDIKRLSRFLLDHVRSSNKKRWSGGVVFCADCVLSVYNVLTQSTEFYFEFKSANEMFSTPDVWQLANGNFFVEDDNTESVTGPSALCDYEAGRPLRTFHERGTYGCTASLELQNGNMLLVYPETTYEYVLSTGETIAHKEKRFSDLIQLRDGRIITLGLSRELLIWSSFAEPYETMYTAFEIDAMVELSPGIVLVGHDKQLSTIDIDTKTIKPYHVQGANYDRIRVLLVMKNGSIVVCCQRIIFVVRHQRVVHEVAHNPKYYREMIREVKDNHVGYTDQDNLNVLDTVTGIVEQHQMPSQGRFISFVFDKI
jgi:hypothetical protein